MSERLNTLETSHAVESERMRTEVTRLRGAEEDAKNNANKVTSLLEELERLRKDLQNTQKEKKAIEDWAQTYQDEMEKVKGSHVELCAAVKCQIWQKTVRI